MKISPENHILDDKDHQQITSWTDLMSSHALFEVVKGHTFQIIYFDILRSTAAHMLEQKCKNAFCEMPSFPDCPCGGSLAADLWT